MHLNVWAQVVAVSSLQRLSGSSISESDSAYVTHCATCFVLASRDLRRRWRHQLRDDEVAQAEVAQAQELAKIFAVHFKDACSRQVSPRHLQLLVKMYNSLLRAVRTVASDFWSDPDLQAVVSTVLDTAAVLLLNNTTAASELVEDVAKLTREAILQIPVELSRDTTAKLYSSISSLASSSDVAVRERCVLILKELAVRIRDAASADELAAKALEFVIDPRRKIREEAVWGVLGPVASDALASTERDYAGLRDRRRSRLPFSAADFEDVFQLLEDSACDERDWLALGSQLSERREMMTPDEAAPTRESVPQLFCSVVREAAGWCVENRLRTHFGGPAQTFASIERLLLSYAAPKADTPSRSARSQPENGGLLSTEATFPSNAWHGIGKWMTLEFVSALELLIGHACTSGNSELDPESEAYKARLFYRANKAVCDDWLNRIRSLLAELSSGASSLELSRLHLYAIASVAYSKLRRLLQSSSTARGASDRLSSELRAAEGDLDAALFALCRCCCDLKDADSIVGFQKWGRGIATELAKRRSAVSDKNGWDDGSQPPLFGWLTAMRHEACMHYEDAVEAYEELLRPILCAERRPSEAGQTSVLDLFEAPDVHLRMSFAAVLGCFRHCAQCYVLLRRWRQLRGLVGAFTSTAAYVAENAKPFPGVQNIVDCVRVWTQELELVSLLETEKESGDAYAFEAGQDKLAIVSDDEKSGLVPQHFVQRWGFASDWARAPAAELSSIEREDSRDDLLDRVRQVALQSGRHAAHATQIVEKKLERLFLDVSQVSFVKLIADGGASGAERSSWLEFPAFSALNPSIHDSTLWSSYAQHLRALISLDHGQVSLNELQWATYLADAAKLARKQRNFELAGRMLTDAEELAKRVSLATPIGISYERARLLAATGAEADGFRLLASVCAFKLSSFDDDHSEDTKGSIVQALGRLAASLNSMATTSPEEVSSISPMLVPIFNFRVGSTDSRNDEIKAEFSGAAVEKCLHVATQISPASPKAWFRYSNWCYELGKREVEQVVEQNGYIHLSPLEELEISAVLNELNVASADRDAIVRGFCHVFENGVIVPQRSDKFRLLCYERMREDADEETINNLVALQAASHARVLRYHLLAADSYGSYLQVQGEQHDSPAPGTQQQKVMLVALRLLHLLTKYGSERDVVASVERTFTVGPVAPWALVVPQLIARADHPDSMVSSIVCLMLQRLARSYPHLLVYPAVVDSAGTKMDSDAPERPSDGSSTPRLAGILNEVRRVSSGLVDGVSLLVSELRRISILWDEAWIAALVKLSTDVARRTSTLERESARVAKNTSLSTDEKRELAERKFVAIMKPVLLSLERVWGATCGNAGRFGSLTPHEQHFFREYGGAIERVLSDLREACTVGRMVDPVNFSPQKVQAIWEPLDAILKSLMGAAGRRDRVSLQDISPAILSIADVFAHTNMPGIARGPGRTDRGRPLKTMVYIHKLLPSISVLKTKTKPKLLQFIGSDGVKHRYLLKAKEDLRLDERIMQFLAAVNELLKADKAASVRGLNAQNYSVIPISNDAGLIQMVPDVVPLFQIYTAHQEHAAGGRNPQMSPPPTAVGRGGGAGNPPSNLPQPPTVQFYAMLKQHGIHDVSQRSKWPLSVLRQIYADLVRQLPRNMIKQELLLRSDDLRESWSKNERLVKSLAVMSVLGYVVGLGDRHLDNILLCANTGEVVHIDYNVCFDKGKRLKVPEVVPFRLTPMLQDALGLTGAEGPFRVAFETTLRVVRSDNSREALLTLLEAFVYSPLTEWITEDSRRTGKTVDLKTRLEVNVNLSLFLSRAEERRQDTTAFGTEFSTCVRDLLAVLQVAKAQLRPLLDEQRRLHSILKKSAAVTMTLSHLEPQARDGASSLATKKSEVQAKRQLMNEVMAKLDAFSNECLERHRQICMWRERAVAFHSIALDRHQSCLVGAEAASFRDVYVTISGLRHTDGALGFTRELAADGLEASCAAVDASVARFRLGVQDVALSLLPSLMAYGQTRHELDEFLLSQCGSTEEDIYRSWRTQTLKVLQAAQSGSVVDVAGFTVDVASLFAKTETPSLASLAESSNMLSQLEHIQARYGFDSTEYGRGILHDLCLPSEEEAGRVVEEIGSLVAAMKVSNAQSQRIMKLASATWIVGAMEAYQKQQDRPSASRRLGNDALAEHALFRQVLVHAKACTMLLELVSTPKGAVKRLRAAELIGGRPTADKNHSNASVTAALIGVVQLLAAAEQFAVCTQEQLMLMELSRQSSLSPGDAHLKTLLAVEKATQDSQACRDVLLAGGESTWQSTLDEWPALKDMIAAGAVVVEQWVAWRKSLQALSIVEFSDAEETRAVSKYWLQLVVGICKPAVAYDHPRGSQQDGASSVSELVSRHIEGFLYDHVVATFHRVLLSIVTREWKIPFAPDRSDDSGLPLREQWAVFMTDNVRECLPLSAMTAIGAEGAGSASSLAGDSLVHQLAAKVLQFADVAGAFWVRDWVAQQRDQRAARLVAIRKLHVSRLHYASWLSQEAPTAAAVGLHRAPTRLELLASLSAQVPRLNALSVELQHLEASVLELAQQLEYVASQLSLLPNNGSAVKESDRSWSRNSQDANVSLGLHERVQACYTKISALFSYTRELCDLVQGISVVETSMRDALPALGGGVELQVDTLGKNLIESARVAALSWNEAQLELAGMEENAGKLQQELDRKKAERDELAASEVTCRESLLQLCTASKVNILDATSNMRTGGERLLTLLTAFDKPRNSAKHQIPGSHRDGAFPPVAASSSSLSASSSQSNADVVSSNVGVDAMKQLRPESSSSWGVGHLNHDATGGVTASGYTFIENERLAKILLRSIRSVTHIDTLEGVLAKHEHCFAALRGVIARLELVTREFVAKTESHLPFKSVGAGSDPSGALRSSFLAITTGTAAAPPAVADAGVDAELVEMGDALFGYMEAVGELPPAHEDSELGTGDVAVITGGGTSMLDMGQQLVAQSLRLFFEATEMADRLSSMRHSQPTEQVRPQGLGDKQQDVADRSEVEDAEDGSSAGPTASASGTRMPSASGGSAADADSALDQLDEQAESQSSVAVSATSNTTATTTVADSITTQARSRYGLQVLSRIEEKLSGTCPDAEARATRVLTVEQQASWLIEEATKVDNLCVMYEGWTPWI